MNNAELIATHGREAAAKVIAEKAAESAAAEASAPPPPERLLLLPNPLKQGSFRNSPCFCDSGKKFKKCCWDSQENSVDLGRFIQAKAFLDIRSKAK